MRISTRGITRPMKRASSVSRNARHFRYSSLLKDARQIHRRTKPDKLVQAEQRRVGTHHHRRKRRRGHVRQGLDGLHVAGDAVRETS